MAEAMASTASSIRMSSIAPTLSKREIGLRSTEIEYDVERAEPDSRVCVGKKSDKTSSRHNLTILDDNNCCVGSIHQRVLGGLITYLRTTFKSRKTTIYPLWQEQHTQIPRQMDQSTIITILPQEQHTETPRQVDQSTWLLLAIGSIA